MTKGPFKAKKKKKQTNKNQNARRRYLNLLLGD